METHDIHITVVGSGYVGLSTAVLLAKNFSVTALDVSEEIVEKINRRESPLAEEAIQKALDDYYQKHPQKKNN